MANFIEWRGTQIKIHFRITSSSSNCVFYFTCIFACM